MRHAGTVALAAAMAAWSTLAFAQPGPAPRGAAVFQQRCAQCHGGAADGRGHLAARFEPRPSNLVASTRSDDYMAQIITLGGAAMGRSAAMPEWGLELSGQEILALVEYLATLRRPQSRG